MYQIYLALLSLKNSLRKSLNWLLLKETSFWILSWDLAPLLPLPTKWDGAGSASSWASIAIRIVFLA